MAKPKFILSTAHVAGKVIERSMNGKYSTKDYCRESRTMYSSSTDSVLTDEQRTVVHSQPTFPDRVNQLLKFFPDAEYISENVVDALNYTCEDDIEKALSHYVDFTMFHPVWD